MRSGFFGGAGAFGLAGAVIAGALFLPAVKTPAAAAEVDGPEVNWLFSAWGTRRGLTEGVEAFVKEVSEKTGGKFTIEIRYGGALSDPKENLDGIQVGAFQSAMTCSFYHPGKTPGLTALNLPFLPIGGLDHRAKVMDAYLAEPAIQAELAKWNAQPMLALLIPSYEIFGRGDLPKSAAAFAGMKFHASGGAGSLMKELGATTVVLPAPELFQSAERGVIDGVVLSYSSVGSYQLDTLMNWHTTNFNLGGPACITVMNKDAYAKLPDQYKKLLQDAKVPAYEHNVAFYNKEEGDLKAAFAAKGMKTMELDQATLDRLAESAKKSAWDKWIADRKAENIDGQALIDSIIAAAKAAKM